MNQQKKGANLLPDLGSKNERKRLHQLQKFVQNTVDYAVKKRLKKISKSFSSKKQMKNIEQRLDDLEKIFARFPDPDRDENGFTQLQRRQE